MSKSSPSQKIGAQGHKWANSVIEDHAEWISRDLPDDYGVDAEAELCVDGVNGEILKLQYKTSRKVACENGKVRFDIAAKYFEYARICRYPVIFVRVDLSKRRAWYLWLQRWLLQERATLAMEMIETGSRTVWVSEMADLTSGLKGELQDVARWRGETQLVLSLLDAMRAAVATGSSIVVDGVVDLLVDVAPQVADASLEIVIQEAILRGERMRGTHEGNMVADHLFALTRRFSTRIGVATVDAMVWRGETYSRAGLIALGILYDDDTERVSTLRLADHFLQRGLPAVAFYCAFRERWPSSFDFHELSRLADFSFADLRLDTGIGGELLNKYANRGPSAILDYLVPVDLAPMSSAVV